MQFFASSLLISSSNTCLGVAQLQLSQIPNLDPLTNSDTVETIYTARRFFYCDDGITVVDPFIPVLDPNLHFIDGIDFTLKCGSDGDKCYGFYYSQLFTDIDSAGASGRGYYVDMQATYNGALSGQPITGLCFRVDESKADPDDFTGYVVLINHVAGKIQLAYYLNQSLIDLPPAGQILAEVSKTLVAGALIYFDVTQAADDTEAGWTINVWSQNPSLSYTHDITHTHANEIPPGAQLTARQANSNAGFVWVGNGNSGTHTAQYQGDNTLNEIHIS